MNHLSQDKKCLEHHAGWNRYPGITAIDPIGRSDKPKPTVLKIGKITKKTRYIYTVYESVIPLYEGPLYAVMNKSTWSKMRIIIASTDGTHIENKYYVKRRLLKDGETWP